MTAPPSIWPDRHQRLAEQARLAEALADAVDEVQSVKFEGRPVLRACVASHFTRPEHLDVLVAALAMARRQI